MVALAMIVKGSKSEAKLLDACLETVAPYVQGIFLTLTHRKGATVHKDVERVADKYNAQKSYWEWDDHFGKARRFNHGQVPDDYEWLVWCDADDILVGGESLAKLTEDATPTTSAIFVEYKYSVDKYGNVLEDQWLPRIFRNDGSWLWANKRVHETPLEQRSTDKVMTNDLHFVHKAKENRRDDSLVRNIKLLEKMAEEEEADPDPRTYFYLAGAYFDANMLEESKRLYELYLDLSGWDDERQQAWLNLGKIYDAMDRPKEARDTFLQALGENPSNPDPYVELGQIELQNKHHARATHWLDMAIIQKPKNNTVTFNPMNRTFRPYMLLAKAHLEIGGENLEIALKAAQAAEKIRPQKDVVDLRKDIEKIIEYKNLIKKTLKETVDMSGEEALEYLDTLPEELQDNPALLAVRRKFTPEKKWPKKSLVIYTGNATIGEWGPWSLSDGVGGSEEAIIRLARQIQDIGWNVTVYANVGSRKGTYDGVEWKNYWEIDFRDEFDVFVAWRSPWAFDKDIKARKKYLWLHDVMEQGEFTKERLDKLDKVIVLSEYHRSLYDTVPDDKIWLSSNGIDPEEFDGIEVERDPRRIIYASSHVRGLAYLLEIWPDVKKHVPDASLHIYYGWESYDAVNKNNPERMAWKHKMQAKIRESEDVFDSGKVSQDEIVYNTMRSGVWAYPCPFPEIFCITAIKSQAGGAIPVSSNFAALEETVKYGTKVAMDKWDEKEMKAYRKALIDMLKSPDVQEKIRPGMIKWARENWSWAKVAKEWIDEFQS